MSFARFERVTFLKRRLLVVTTVSRRFPASELSNSCLGPARVLTLAIRPKSSVQIDVKQLPRAVRETFFSRARFCLFALLFVTLAGARCQTLRPKLAGNADPVERARNFASSSRLYQLRPSEPFPCSDSLAS